MFAGVDTHKDTLAVAVIDHGGRVVRQLECVGQRQLDEDVLAGPHGADGGVGVQPRGEADVDQAHRGIGEQGIQVGGGAEPGSLIWASF